ncbi:MAG: hypothetical protein QOC87_1496 [Actinomycetota bacterium]|nr:hypothetical protein [Actinomycetota bacterium]
MRATARFARSLSGKYLQRYYVGARDGHEPALLGHYLEYRIATVDRCCLNDADGLGERVIGVVVQRVTDRDLATEVLRPIIVRGLEARVGARYSPRSSAGANGLSIAPPDASGCSSNH